MDTAGRVFSVVTYGSSSSSYICAV